MHCTNINCTVYKPNYIFIRYICKTVVCNTFYKSKHKVHMWIHRSQYTVQI